MRIVHGDAGRDAAQHVVNRMLLPRGVVHVAGRDRLYADALGQLHQGAIDRVLSGQLGGA